MLAEYAVFNEEAVVHLPSHLSFEEAATLPCAAVTAWVALTAHRQVTAGAARHTRPGPVERRERRRRKSSRRPRVERLPLLRRAYDHHRDLRTRLPAAAVARPIDRARQLMTSTLLSPSHIAAPLPGRYRTGDGYPLPTEAVSAAFDRQNADPSLQDYGSDPAHSDQNQPRG
jgi:hypothetical protein